LETEKDIGRFLVLGGPVSCLVSATVGTTALMTQGLISLDNAPVSWGTWWIGDTIGVLVFAPLLMIALSRSKDISIQRRLSIGIPLLVMFFLVVVFFLYAKDAKNETIRNDFNRVAESYSDAFEGNLEKYLFGTYSIKSLFLSSENVTREEFKTFVHQNLPHYPGILAYSYNKRVLSEELEPYVADLKSRGFDHFEIKKDEEISSRIKPAEEYVFVSYIEPFEKNKTALGLNVVSEESRNKALAIARDTGETIATSPIKLVQEKGEQRGFLLFQPLYKNKQSHKNLEERRENIDGFIVGVFNVHDMVETVFLRLKDENIQVQVLDVTNRPKEDLLYGTRQFSNLIPWSKTIHFAGREWVLNLSPNNAYLLSAQGWSVWSVLSAGLFFVSLFGTLLLIITGRTAAVQQLAEEQTTSLKEQEVKKLGGKSKYEIGSNYRVFAKRGLYL